MAGAVAVPEGVVVRPGEALPATLPLPAIVKPVSEGSSKGIHDGLALAFDRRVVEERVQAVAARYRQPALVEGFVAGPEVTVAVLGCEKPEVAAMMQILPQRGPLSHFVYTIEAKRDWQQRVRYAVPPNCRPKSSTACAARRSPRSVLLSAGTWLGSISAWTKAASRISWRQIPCPASLRRKATSCSRPAAPGYPTTS